MFEASSTLRATANTGAYPQWLRQQQHSAAHLRVSVSIRQQCVSASVSLTANHRSEDGSAACNNDGHLLLRHQLHQQRCEQQQQQLLTFSDGAAVALHTYAAAVFRASESRQRSFFCFSNNAEQQPSFGCIFLNEAEAMRSWMQLPLHTSTSAAAQLFNSMDLAATRRYAISASTAA